VNCAQAIEAMDRQFVDGLEPALATALRAHLEGCASCKARYDRLAAVEQRLDQGFSPERLTQLQSELFARVGSPGPSPAPAARAWPRWVAAGAAVSAALAVAVVATQGRPPEFQPKGAGTDGYTLKAYCVREGAVVSTAGEDRAVRCRPGDVLQLAYSAPSSTSLGVVSADGALVLIDPAKHVAFAPGNELPLPFSTPIDGWLTAPLRFEATFTDPASGDVRVRRSFVVEPDEPGPAPRVLP